MSESITGWHFLPNDGRTANGENIAVVPGKVLKLDDPENLSLCSHGYHGSVRAIDALRYAPGNIICRVKLHGTVIKSSDKIVATQRTCIWMADATRTLQEFSIWCAERAIELVQSKGITVDPRSIDAIRVARLWLSAEVTLEDMRNATDAARATAYAAYAAARAAYAAYAAEAVARAARAAAYAADAAARAAYAARATADAAARAAYAARATAYAADDVQNAKLEEMFLALENSQYAITQAVS